MEGQRFLLCVCSYKVAKGPLLLIFAVVEPSDINKNWNKPGFVQALRER